MNIIRAEDNAILIWNLERARTAYISGEEMIALSRWANGESNPFSQRLEDLGLLAPLCKQAVANAIQLSANINAPINSFNAPESIHIELTEHCPLNCPMCYKDGKVNELSTDYLLEVIRQAAEMGVFQIAFGGGEPLIYPYLCSVVTEISQFKMASTITTSGMGLTASRINELKQAGLNHIQISMNGSSKDIHSRSRDGFDEGIAALHLLQHSDFSFGINWVARMDNIDDFPKMAELANNCNANNLNILRYKPSPTENYNDCALTSEKTDLLENFIRKIKSVRIKVDSAFSNLRCKINSRTSFMAGCGAGRRFFTVGACGSYMPCSHINMKEKPMNLHDNSLKHFWENSKHLAMFRSLGESISAPCSDCSYLHGCYSCRAVVLPTEGCFFSGDKSCGMQGN